MGTIKILSPGFLTLIEDHGRVGYQQFGVPVSGVMDSLSHRIANILVGNDEEEGVLEITFSGPTIEFHQDGVIAVTGANLIPTLNHKKIPMWRSIPVKAGDLLSFQGIISGCRSYIAFAGGIHVPPVMGSKSTYLKGKLGGYHGRALKTGDTLAIGHLDSPYPYTDRRIPHTMLPSYESQFEVRVVLGPQEELFAPQGIRTFLQSGYEVTQESDRMGYRLSGAPIELVGSSDIISDGIAMGAIQVPSHGQPIIMMADRQTTGGYGKIGHVIWADLWKIAQAKPGDEIRFRQVTIYEAHQALREFESKIAWIRENCTLGKVIDRKLLRIRVGSHLYDVEVEECEA